MTEARRNKWLVGIQTGFCEALSAGKALRAARCPQAVRAVRGSEAELTRARPPSILQHAPQWANPSILPARGVPGRTTSTGSSPWFAAGSGPLSHHHPALELRGHWLPHLWAPGPGSDLAQHGCREMLIGPGGRPPGWTGSTAERTSKASSLSF